MQRPGAVAYAGLTLRDDAPVRHVAKRARVSPADDAAASRGAAQAVLLIAARRHTIDLTDA